jgi:hypothetical protein
MKISQEELKRIIQQEASEIMGEEADPSGVDSERFPIKLSTVDADAAKVVATHGLSKFDNDAEDDIIKVTKKADGVASVGNLKPSQSSMNIGKAMTFVLHMLDPNSRMEPGGDLGAFISKDFYIMDGHHRWVSTAMADPSKQVGGFYVDFPGEQLVAILNAMTKGRYGVMDGKPASGGFEQFKEKPIRDMLTKMVEGGISQGTVPDTFKGWQARTPEEVLKILEDWTGKEGEDALESAVTKMVNNLNSITMETPSWAPERPDMPVIDEPDIPDAIRALSRGEVDVNEPYFKGEEDPVGQPPLEESRNLMSISKERLQEIIKEELQNRQR